MMLPMVLALCSGMVLEYEDVHGFSYEVKERPGGSRLRIQGLAFHSALAVKELKTAVEGRTMFVKVLLVPAKTGLSGRFDYQLDVPNNVDSIVFGAQRYPIWKRKSAVP